MVMPKFYIRSAPDLVDIKAIPVPAKPVTTKPIEKPFHEKEAKIMNWFNAAFSDIQAQEGGQGGNAPGSNPLPSANSPRIWFGDELDTPPPGWRQICTYGEVSQLIKTDKIDTISLGDRHGERSDGGWGDIIRRIQNETVRNGDFVPPQIVSHSVTRRGRAAQERAIMELFKHMKNAGRAFKETKP